VYCWYHPKIGLWLGATPETLIKIEGNRFSIMALAGTQDYKGTLEVNWQQKEKVEQQVVTDFIIENLESLVENVKVSKTETVKAGNLLHLKTNITAQLKSNLNLNEIITALHPTPAVCGTRKKLRDNSFLKMKLIIASFTLVFWVNLILKLQSHLELQSEILKTELIL
jgi:isochorismate synthase